MSKVKSLRAADLGYTWAPWLPDGATWTRDEDGTVDFWRTPEIEPLKGVWNSEEGSLVMLVADRDWLGLTPPDFGDRPWRECILVKGQEPELPPCPPGDGWIEWSGGECPVPPTTDVDVQFRNGEVIDNRAGDWNWGHDGCEGDIVRYRVHQPKYRPYNDDEMKQLVRIGEYLERKDGTAGSRAWHWQCWDGVIHVRVGLGAFKSAELLEHWRHRDGSPCGVEVSGQ